jgi:hypothetical protein
MSPAKNRAAKAKARAASAPLVYPTSTLPNGAKLPTSVIEAMQVVEAEKDCPAYFINAKHEGHKLNDYAQLIMDFVPSPTGSSQLRLILHMTEEYLPVATPHSVPRLDFFMQQLLLSLRARGGKFPLPIVTVIAHKQTGERQGFYEAKVHARHIFSPKREYLGTLCHLDLTPISQSEYDDYYERDALISPLPEELLREKSIFSPKLDKLLYSLLRSVMAQSLNLYDAGTSKAEKSWRKAGVIHPFGRKSEMTLTKPAVDMTDDELKEFFKLRELEKAIKELPHDPEAKRHGEVEYLYRLRELVKRMLDTEMKQRLWRDTTLPGEVSFHFSREKEQFYYYKAAVTGNTATVRDPLPEEIESIYGEEAAEQYRLRLERRQTSRADALPERKTPPRH